MSVDDDLRCGRVTLPAACLTWRADPSGGPGGQHANTSETRVTLTADLAGAGLEPAMLDRLVDRLGTATPRVTAAAHRSQWRNRVAARRQLAELIEAAAEPPVTRRPTRPSRRARGERLEEKRRQSARKADRAWRARPDDT